MLGHGSLAPCRRGMEIKASVGVLAPAEAVFRWPADSPLTVRRTSGSHGKQRVAPGCSGPGITDHRSRPRSAHLQPWRRCPARSASTRPGRTRGRDRGRCEPDRDPECAVARPRAASRSGANGSSAGPCADHHRWVSTTSPLVVSTNVDRSWGVWPGVATQADGRGHFELVVVIDPLVIDVGGLEVVHPRRWEQRDVHRVIGMVVADHDVGHVTDAHAQRRERIQDLGPRRHHAGIDDDYRLARAHQAYGAGDAITDVADGEEHRVGRPRPQDRTNTQPSQWSAKMGRCSVWRWWSSSASPW